MEIRSQADLGPLIREARVSAGLDKKQLSTAARISLDHLYKIERGQADPAFSTVVRLLAVCNRRLYAGKPPEVDRSRTYWGTCPYCGIPFVSDRQPEPKRWKRVFTRHCPLCGEQVQVTAHVDEERRWIVPVQIERGGNGK